MLGPSQPRHISIYLQAKERALLHAYYDPHNQARSSGATWAGSRWPLPTRDG